MKSFILLLIFIVLTGCKEKETIIPSAEVISVSPKEGQAGTIVKIRGNNFSNNSSENVVKFGAVNAEVVSSNDTVLMVKAPAAGKSAVIEISVRDKTIFGPEFKYYNVYCYGGNYYFAGYWKNGNPVKFGTKGFIYDLAVSGEDVYAIGFESIGSTPQYWKNGQSQELEGLTLAYKLTGIAISGNDVYVCGIQYLPYPRYKIAKYWKNGKLIFSSPAYDFVRTEAYDIAVNGTDVYMVGMEYPKAMLWKNGTPVELTDGKSLSDAARIRFTGSTMHIIGNQISNSILYWKDEILTNSKVNVYGSAKDFTIQGSDIFVAGYGKTLHGQIQNKFIAKYWKNGIENDLSDGTSNRYATSIEVTEDAVYVLTNEPGASDIYPYFSKLTKNGIDVTPDFGPGVTGSIIGMLVVYY